MNPQALINDIIENREKEASEEKKQEIREEAELVIWLRNETTQKKLATLKELRKNMEENMARVGLDPNVTDAQCRIYQITFGVYQTVLNILEK